MSNQVYIPDPPINDVIVGSDGKTTKRFQDWMTAIQTNVNPLLKNVKVGNYQTVAGSVTQVMPASGATASSLARATILTPGASGATITSVTPGANIITVVMSVDPGSDTTINWLII